MSQYKKVLVALDLTEHSPEVVKRAKALSSEHDVRITLAHVVEPLALAYGGDIPLDMSDVQEQIKEQSAKRIAVIAKRFEIPDYDCRILIGQPEAEIRALADEIEADLVVVGCHSRAGLSMLFGSTANSMLNGASCDVLAVRVGD